MGKEKCVLPWILLTGISDCFGHRRFKDEMRLSVTLDHIASYLARIRYHHYHLAVTYQVQPPINTFRRHLNLHGALFFNAYTTTSRHLELLIMSFPLDYIQRTAIA